MCAFTISVALFNVHTNDSLVGFILLISGNVAIIIVGIVIHLLRFKSSKISIFTEAFQDKVKI